MNGSLKMFYETMGSSSYMAVTCPPEVRLVNYELEMMLSNEIKNFLGTSRQMLDGNTVIYYNITSRIPLKQVLDKRKLTRKELFRLIEGAILAIRDAAAFRLPEEGIILEPEYIYVNPASCAPAFMFIPLQEPAGMGIRELLSDLVLHDKIELSNDNFIQKLLVELNRQPFSLEELEKNLKQNQMPEQSTKPVNQQPVKPRIPEPQAVRQQPLDRQPLDYGQAGAEHVVASRVPVLEKSTEGPKTPASSKGKETGDSKKAKKQFMLPQALVMVALASGISFGLFTDQNGGIVLNNVLAFVIVVALAEVILYREVYKNSTNPKKKKGRETMKGKMKGNKTARPQPAEKPNLSRQLADERPQPLQPMQRQQPIQTQSIPSQPTLNPIYEQQMRPQFLYGETADTELEVPTEFSEEAERNQPPAYLEYYENGKLSRIPIDSFNGIFVGRLERQVDFAVKSPRVGNVHAKFFSQNGQCYVVDINSKNGTYINGSRARIESNNPCLLHDKDRIMLADCEFTIRCSEG